jgi:hypothetical protein
MQKMIWSTIVVAAGCSGSREAVTIELEVTTSPLVIAAVTTDLGYRIELDRVRVAVTRVEFTIEGEMHDLAARVARPHPGHSSGGEVTGELPCDHILVWDGAVSPALGTATLIVGDYRGANFAIRAAGAADALAVDDPLLGHAFHLTGTISKDGTSRDLDAVLDVEPDTAVIGAVFEEVVTPASTAPLAIEFYPGDPFEADTAFDAVDFFALPTTTEGGIEIRPGSAPHNIIRRKIQTHDHYGVVAL